MSFTYSCWLIYNHIYKVFDDPPNILEAPFKVFKYIFILKCMISFLIENQVLVCM